MIYSLFWLILVLIVLAVIFALRTKRVREKETGFAANDSQLRTTQQQKSKRPAFGKLIPIIIWLITIVLLMVFPSGLLADFIASVIYPKSVVAYCNGSGDAPLIIVWAMCLGAFLIGLIFSIILSKILKTRLVLLMLLVLVVISGFVFLSKRSCIIRRVQEINENYQKQEEIVQSPFVKRFADHIEYNDGQISFRLPVKFDVVKSGNSNPTVFSDKTDHISFYNKGIDYGYGKPCDPMMIGFFCENTANNVVIRYSRADKNKIKSSGSETRYEIFKTNSSTRSSGEFNIQAATRVTDEVITRSSTENLQIFNNDLKNSIKILN